MGLADAIQAQRGKPSGRMPVVEQIRAQLDGDDLEVFNAALLDESLPAARLAKALTEEGYPISDSAIHAWRRKHGTG